MQQSSSNSSYSNQITYCSMDPLKNSSTFSVHFEELDSEYCGNHENKVIIGGHYVVRKREIWFVSSAIVFFTLCVVLSVTSGLLFSKTEFKSSKLDNVITYSCVQPQCFQLSSQIIQSLNQSVNACSNFDQFVCGGLQSQSGYDKVNENLDVQFSSILTSSRNNESNKLPEKIKRFYQSCVVDAHGARQKGIPILNIIDKIGGWNALGNWNENEWEVQSALYSATCNLLVEVFFSLSVVPDKNFKNSNRLKISFSTRQMSSTWSNQFWEQKDIDAYKEFLNFTATLLLEDEMWRKKINIFNMPQKLKSFITDVVYMENRIYKLSMLNMEHKTTPGRQFSSMHNEVQIKHLYQAFPFLNWVECLNEATHGSNLNNNTIVEVDVLEYLRQIAFLLQSTPKRSINNLLVWRLISEFLPFSTIEYQNILSNYQENVWNFKQFLSIEKHCLQILKTSILRAATFSLIAKDNSNFEFRLSDVVTNIRRTLLQQLWLKNTSTASEIENLNVLNENEYLSDTNFINSFYSKLQITDNFFDNVLSMRRFVRQKLGETLLNATAVAPFFNSKHYLLLANNALLIPYHYLAAPFIDSHYPMHVIYGRLGTTIALLFLNAAIETESFVNRSTHLLPLTFFLSECANKIKHQIEIVNPQFDKNPFHFDIDRVLHLLAVKVTFESYQNHLFLNKNDSTLPGLEKFSLEQSFFISAFQRNCKWSNIQSKNLLAMHFVKNANQSINKDANFLKEYNQSFKCENENTKILKNCLI